MANEIVTKAPVVRFIKDGKVAVLVSPGFGAGWTSWNSEFAEAMAFDADIVQLVLDGADTTVIESKAKEKWPDGYFGGARDLTVEWLPQGTAFDIQEYDGSESLRVLGDMTYFVA